MSEDTVPMVNLLQHGRGWTKMLERKDLSHEDAQWLDAIVAGAVEKFGWDKQRAEERGLEEITRYYRGQVDQDRRIKATMRIEEQGRKRNEERFQKALDERRRMLREDNAKRPSEIDAMTVWLTRAKVGWFRMFRSRVHNGHFNHLGYERRLQQWRDLLPADVAEYQALWEAAGVISEAVGLLPRLELYERLGAIDNYMPKLIKYAEMLYNMDSPAKVYLASSFITTVTGCARFTPKEATDES